MEILQGNSQFEVNIFTSVDGGLVLRGTNIDPIHDIISISTSKNLNSIIGTWNIVFAAPNNIDDYWFEVVNVGDYVEISGAGIYDKMQVIMRGLVDNVSLSEDYSSGQPQRRITLSGRDLGALLNDIAIIYIAYLDPENTLLGMFGEKDFPTICGSVEDIFRKLWGYFEKRIDLKFGSVDILSKIYMGVHPFRDDLVATMQHLVHYQDSFYNVFKTYQDAPFHELIMYDDYDYAHFVLRPSRLKDARGKYHSSVADIISSVESPSQGEDEYGYIAAGVKGLYPQNLEVNNTHIIRRNVAKNSDYIYNYYFVKPYLADISGHAPEIYAMGSDPPEHSLNPYFQIDPKLPAYVGKFGVRKLESPCILIASMDVGQNMGAKADGSDGTSTRGWVWESSKNVLDFVKIAKEMNQTQIAWFLHNQYLLSGTIDIVGTNKAIVGSYLYCSSPMDGNEFYIEGVTHNWVWGQDFTTTLTVTRGQPKNGGVAIYGVKNKCYLDGTVTDPYIPIENIESRAGISWGPLGGKSDIKKSKNKSGFTGNKFAGKTSGQADEQSGQGVSVTQADEQTLKKYTTNPNGGTGKSWNR